MISTPTEHDHLINNPLKTYSLGQIKSNLNQNFID